MKSPGQILDDAMDTARAMTIDQCIDLVKAAQNSGSDPLYALNFFKDFIAKQVAKKNHQDSDEIIKQMLGGN